ncbi:PDZ domain (Also known as DHR or GLGF) domain-containing protein [Ditylenchus destructor]|nr:PDZ domain (Also known as DHR or GLGF) domain-containing protein [Ditylenchus destructor]
MVNYPSLPPNAPSPRLCVVKKNAAHQEYGFNLHAEKGKGQFVGAVDESSPADRSGLRPADRIFAVNGESIVGAPHKEVVQKIKLDPLQCELLVINEEGALWYQEQGIPITPNLPNIIRTCSEFDLSYMPSHSATSTFSSNGSSRRSSPPMIISRASARLRSPNVNQYGKSYKGSTWYQTTHVAHYNSSTSNGSFEEYPKSFAAPIKSPLALYQPSHPFLMEVGTVSRGNRISQRKYLLKNPTL